ncbi:MAG: hypothetical protein ACTSW8_06320, partial [Candidatus Thorarchaeota archaeon]
FEALVRNISFNAEQESFVKKSAVEHLNMGKRGEFLTLCHILSCTGTKLHRAPTSTSLTHYSAFKVGCVRPFDIAIDLLTKAGVFHSDEKILYYDVGVLGVQKKDVGRSGLLIITNKRLVAVGGYAFSLRDKRHKLYYGDLREPYLSCVDFVSLDKLENVELKKNEIRAKYYTEYLIEKKKTFYGPYFFRFDLPTSVKVKSGTMKIIISLPKLEEREPVTKNSEFPFMDEAFERWNQVELPKDYDKTRLDKLFRHIVLD